MNKRLLNLIALYYLIVYCSESSKAQIIYSKMKQLSLYIHIR